MKKSKSIQIVVLMIVLCVTIFESCKEKPKKGKLTDYDGNVYTTITIGTQTWTVENLKVTHYQNGDPIANVTEGAAWGALTTGAYCWYKNDITNKATNGALYNWYAVADSRNIAPVGWHIPSDAEWTVLISYLGGEDIAGGKMKETGINHWLSPNMGATNKSGFTCLPSGERTFSNGSSFIHLGNLGYFWSSTQCGNSEAWIRVLNCYEEYCNRHSDYKGYGYSVRCVKD